MALTLLAVADANAMQLQDYVLSQSKAKGIGYIMPSKVGQYYFKLADDNSQIEKIDYKTGKTSVFFDTKTARGSKIEQWDGFAVGEGEGYVLLWTASTPVYRHSFKADYYVYDVRHNKLDKLSQTGQEEIAVLSPNERMVAYVRDNNIFIKKLDYWTEVQVTTDGKKNAIINGVPDWVYQEEFGMLSSLCWSPDNTMLAFIRWDESKVPMYSITTYQGDCNANEQYALYPGRFDYKYPVAGENNSIVSVVAYDVDNRTLKTMKLPIGTDDYIPHIAYSKSASKLMVSTLNRTQNDLHIYAVNPRSTIAKEVYNEKSNTWIDDGLANAVAYYDDLFVIPSNKSGTTQLYLYSIQGALVKQLTSGKENVTKYYGYDKLNKRYYFQATNGPLNRTVAYVDDKGKIYKLDDGQGTYAASAFSNDFTHYIQCYSSAATPNQYKVTTATSGKAVRTIELNEEYAKTYTSSDVPKREFFTLNSDGVTLNGYMIKPLDFDQSKKYPVILSQYSGPGSQMVLNSWKLDWEEYFATQGYIIVCVDGRGTGGRGKAFQDVVYQNLGKYESIDQVATAKYMAQLPYVDKSKIGIWGWSYGGYETLMAMSQPNSPFAAGVAIAPVTSWKFYDTIYAERYMRTPNENAAGYASSAPLDQVANLQGKVLIMFGSADDNVHIVNEMQYIARLQTLNKDFDMMVYPNMNHSINGCDIRYTLYKKVLDFYNAQLKTQK